MTFPPAADLAGDALACRRGERLVFRGLDFRLPAGGALILSGPNGSGKSSLLRLLATLLAPAAGRLSWDGVPVTGDPAGYRALIHYVGHLDGVKPALNPREIPSCVDGQADYDGIMTVLKARIHSMLDEMRDA